MVLDDEIIDQYLADLAIRYRSYRQLIDTGRITLTQNKAFERFEQIILQQGILRLADAKSVMKQGDFRLGSLQKLAELNPGSLFHIRMDFQQRVRDWSAFLQDNQSKKMSDNKKLELINSLLPTRLKVAKMSPELAENLRAALRAHATYASAPQQESWQSFYQTVKKLFIVASKNIYSFKGEMLDFFEFTVIYPVGTLNQFAGYDGIDMPLFPYPGRHQLRIHQRTEVVDHIPEDISYSYLPWIPYMHVGERLHNSFHSLWFHIDTKSSDLIPTAWKNNTADSRDGKPYPRLWLLSRGPMSHGCTHVNAGHISELRQMLPSAEEKLAQVMTFRNKSNHFDIFDINGDGRPEVMGVKYFYSYSLKDKKPYKMRAKTDRKSFYAWLYKKGYRYDGNDQLIFKEVSVSRFVGMKAEKGRTYGEIPLYEAEYRPETIQFFAYKPIPFVRELRRISSTYAPDRNIVPLPLQLPQRADESQGKSSSEKSSDKGH